MVLDQFNLLGRIPRKTGIFGYTLAYSKNIVEAIVEEVVPEDEREEAIKEYGLGKPVKITKGRETSYILQLIKNNSLVRYLVNWGRMASLWPAHLTTACCSVEFGAVSSSRYDPERFGWIPATGSLRQSDVLLIEGTVNSKMAQRVRIIYDQMPNPKWVIAMGSCLPAGSLIYTSLGVKPIEDVGIGELVFTYDISGRKVVLSRVLAKRCNGVKQVYKLKAGSYELEATADHPIAVYEKTISHKYLLYCEALRLLNIGMKIKDVARVLDISPKVLMYWLKRPPRMCGFDIVWKPLIEVKPGDYVIIFNQTFEGLPYRIEYVHNGRLRKPVKFPEYVTDEMAWLIGLYLGDGWRDEHRVGFSIMPNDYIRSSLEERIHVLFNIKPSSSRQVVIDSTAVSSIMACLQLGRNLNHKRIPLWLFTIPLSQIKHFIAGLIESDGYVEPDGCAYIYSANRKLLEDLVELCHYRSIHISSIYEVIKESAINGRKVVSKQYCIRLPKHIVASLPLRRPDYLSRARNSIQRTRNGRSKLKTNHEGIAVERVVTVESTRLATVYDIQVQNNHNFFAHGLLVHNCAISGGLYARDSYNVLQGLNDIVPVDVYVPGCPPRPETLFQGFILLRDKILKSRLE